MPSLPPQPAAGGAHATQRVANRAIACHTVERLRLAGVGAIAVVGRQADLEAVRACVENDLPGDIEVTYLVQESRDDLLGALQTALAFVEECPVIVHFADGLLAQHLDELVQDRSPHDLPDLLLLLHRNDASRGGLPVATQKLLGLSELNGHGARLAVTGVCVFGPGALRRLQVHSTDGTDMIAIAGQLDLAGCRLEAEIVQGWRRYGGDPEDLLELNRLVLDQQVASPEPFDRGDNRIEGRVVIHPTAVVRSSIVVGPCIIGAEAHVSDSYIGPYTSIGARVEIEGAEIVRSIVADDARIKHVGGRIESSTIGRNASIFRDFGLPRAMRLHIGDGAEMALN